MSTLLVSDFLLVGLPLLHLSRLEPIRTACENAMLCMQMVKWFPMENFLFYSIYLLAMTQESALILTTCHKTPKSQMYYTDVVFNGKDYNTTMLIPGRSQ